MKNLWNDESGVLTFEWILLITLLVIGIVGGLAVMRDAYIVEATETASAMLALDSSYSVAAPLQTSIKKPTVSEGSANGWNYAGATTSATVTVKGK